MSYELLDSRAGTPVQDTNMSTRTRRTTGGGRSRLARPARETAKVPYAVVAAMHRSVKLAEFERTKRPTLKQAISRPGVERPRMIHAAAPSGGS